MQAASAFLSKTFLAVFAFLLANVEPAASGVSGWLHIPIFTISGVVAFLMTVIVSDFRVVSFKVLTIVSLFFGSQWPTWH